MLKKIIPLFILCASCHSCPEKVPPFTSQEFNGREEIIAYGQAVRRPIYQAKVPIAWRRIDPDESASLTDTTKPIISFVLEEQLLLTVHTFPTDALEERIPPEAQVNRWKKQMRAQTNVAQSIGHGGFCGLYFEGIHENTTVCAWSLQLDFDHYQTLHFLATTVEEEEHYKQMAADYTIKVSGPTHLINKHRKELMLFADSFELIQDIPSRL